MKTRLTTKFSVGLALLTAMLCNFSQGSAVAQTEYSPERLLVGKWQQQYGTCISESVFTADGRFTSITRDQFRSFYSEGRWEIKDGVLISHFVDWSPRSMPNVDGSTTPIWMPEWESTWIRFLDYDRLQNKVGIAYRVR